MTGCPLIVTSTVTLQRYMTSPDVIRYICLAATSTQRYAGADWLYRHVSNVKCVGALSSQWADTLQISCEKWAELDENLLDWLCELVHPWHTELEQVRLRLKTR